MNVTELPKQETFRTTAIRGLPADADVDRKNRVIRGAKAMQVGRLNSGDARPWKVDQTTLEQLVDFVNQSKTGVKMRFAHPNMSRDGMGRHLGRAKNARIVGEGDDAYVAVDAHLGDFATRSPNGNLAEHVMDLAEQDPELFGLSIAPLLDYDEMESAYKAEKKAGTDDGREPIRMQGLRAIDFVDDPAATRGGLFSLDSDSLADLPAMVTNILDTFFDEADPSVIRGRFDEFLRSYFQSRGIEMTQETAKPAANPTTEPETVQPQPELQVNPELSSDQNKQAARDELTRHAELFALCELAKVDEKTRDLFVRAGFSRAEAQQYLRDSGHLSTANPPVSEGAPEKTPKTDEDKFGEEFDRFADIYQRQGLTREDYIASRKRDN